MADVFCSITTQIRELTQAQGRGLGDLINLGGLGGQGVAGQQIYNAQAQGELISNQFTNKKRELTIKEELQAETDKWLEGICI